MNHLLVKIIFITMDKVQHKTNCIYKIKQKKNIRKKKLQFAGINYA